MSIAHVTDGVTDLDSLLFNPIIDRVNGDAGPLANMKVGIYNALDYATGDGITNDRDAIQSLIGSNRTIYFPGDRDYLIRNTNLASVSDAGLAVPIVANGLVIPAGTHDLTIIGGSAARLIYAVQGGDGTPLTNYESFAWGSGAGTQWRGSLFRIVGSEDPDNPTRNITFINLDMDGQWPNLTNGPDYLGHRAIWMQDQGGTSGVYYDNIVVQGCHIHHWFDTGVYSGGSDDGTPPEIDRMTVIDSHIHDIVGSLVSFTAKRAIITRNDFHSSLYYGIENVSIDGWQSITDNHIHDIGDETANVGTGITFAMTGDGTGGANIEGNRIERMLYYGIQLNGALWSQVHHNTFIDCGREGITGCAVVLFQGGGYPHTYAHGIDITDNLILADHKTYINGIQVIYDGGGLSAARNVRIRRNTIGKTPYAEANGKEISLPIEVFPELRDSVDIRDNLYAGQMGDTTSAQTYNQLLTTTGITTVASAKVPYNGLMLASVSVRVITGTTNVTIVVTSEDEAGSPTSYDVLTLTGLTVGSYTYPSVLVPVADRGTVAVKVTAGTANQVYATATVRDA